MKTDTNQNLYGAENQKAQGIKFVITTVLVAAVIIGIAVWGIVFVVSNTKRDAGLAGNGAGTDSSEVATKDTKSEDTSTQEIVEVTDLSDADATETTEGVNASEAPAEEANGTTTSAQSARNIPKTGPEDLLPVALLAGIAVAYFGSRRLVNSLA